MNAKVGNLKDNLLAEDVLCMACLDARCDFKPLKFQRRPMGENDVKIKMMLLRHLSH